MTDWTKPVELTDVQIAFPADALDYMPSRAEAEEGLAALKPKEAEKWREFVTVWFFSGLSPKTKFYLRDGVDGDKAVRHLGAILGSYAPSHEHKEAAAAYLCSLWFKDVKDYRKKERNA